MPVTVSRFQDLRPGRAFKRPDDPHSVWVKLNGSEALKIVPGYYQSDTFRLMPNDCVREVTISQVQVVNGICTTPIGV